MPRRSMVPGSLLVLVVTLSLVIAASTRPASAGPTLGFVEEWPGTSLQGWGSGAALDNPGTGGYLGAGDGYLRMATPFGGNLGAFGAGPEYTGDWVSAGITQVGFWLDDVDADQALEMHFLVGAGHSNVWQYDVGFIPPENAWGQFVVDLSSAANWTRIIGTTGTFRQALETVDRVHFRHDLAPYTQFPDPIEAEVGVDHLLLTDGVVGVGPRPRVITSPVELAPPSPNPARGPVTLTLRSADASAVRLEILDASGRRVRSAALPAGVSGTRMWLWDGRDDRGAAVAPGVYRVRAWNGQGGTTRSIARIR